MLRGSSSLHGLAFLEKGDNHPPPDGRKQSRTMSSSRTKYKLNFPKHGISLREDELSLRLDRRYPGKAYCPENLSPLGLRITAIQGAEP